MKLSYALFVCSSMAASSNAFVVPRNVQRSVVSLGMATESEEAVKAAMSASEEFGKSSKEAAAAWALVEEIDAANAHAKTAVLEKERSAKKAEEAAAAAAAAAAAPKKAPVLHVDTAEAVEQALKASKMYGATSPEARIAWDIVEEMDAANSHHQPEDIHVMKEAVKKAEVVKEKVVDLTGMPTTSEEAVQAALLASRVYGRSSKEARLAWELVEEMDQATSHHKKGDIHVKAEPEKVEVKVKAPAEKKPTKKATADAVKRAMEAAEKYGLTSKEAILAWEEVEEIDSSNSHHSTWGSG